MPLDDSSKCCVEMLHGPTVATQGPKGLRKRCDFEYAPPAEPMESRTRELQFQFLRIRPAQGGARARFDISDSPAVGNRLRGPCSLLVEPVEGGSSCTRGARVGGTLGRRTGADLQSYGRDGTSPGCFTIRADILAKDYDVVEDPLR